MRAPGRRTSGTATAQRCWLDGAVAVTVWPRGRAREGGQGAAKRSARGAARKGNWTGPLSEILRRRRGPPARALSRPSPARRPHGACVVARSAAREPGLHFSPPLCPRQHRHFSGKSAPLTRPVDEAAGRVARCGRATRCTLLPGDICSAWDRLMPHTRPRRASRGVNGAKGARRNSRPSSGQTLLTGGQQTTWRGSSLGRPLGPLRA